MLGEMSRRRSAAARDRPLAPPAPARAVAPCAAPCADATTTSAITAANDRCDDRRDDLGDDRARDARRDQRRDELNALADHVRDRCDRTFEHIRASADALNAMMLRQFRQKGLDPREVLLQTRQRLQLAHDRTRDAIARSRSPHTAL